MTEVKQTEWQQAFEAGDCAGTAGARVYPNWKVADMIRDALASARTENEALKNTLRQRNDELHCGLARIAELKAETAALAERVKVLREALVQADLKIRSFPGTDQSDVEFSRATLAGETP